MTDDEARSILRDFWGPSRICVIEPHGVRGSVVPWFSPLGERTTEPPLTGSQNHLEPQNHSTGNRGLSDSGLTQFANGSLFLL